MNTTESEKIKLIEQQVLSQNLMNLKNQLSTLNIQIDELNRLKESLSKLKGIKERKTQVAVGNGIFLEAILNEPKDVVMNIGANILVKKEFNEAMKIVDKQIKGLEGIFIKMSNEVGKAELRLIQQ